LAEAETALEDTELVAPAAGTVRTRAVEPGTIVAAGSPVFVVSVKEPVYIRAYIPETQMGRIQPGMPVRLETDSRPDEPYRGHIGFISPRAEFTPKTVQTEALRTNLVYRFRVVLEESDRKLRQGMPVTVVIEDPAKPADQKAE
jgi:HlyD family secretion protein